MKRRRFLQLAAGAVALPAMLARRLGADLSVATRSFDRRHARRRPGRCPRASDLPMAVGTSRSAFSRREPAGSRHQYCHRTGRSFAWRRLHLAHGQRGRRDQRDALREARFQLHSRHRRGRGCHARSPRHGGEPVNSSQDGAPSSSHTPKSAPGKVNMASGGNGAPSHIAGELFKMMAGVNIVHVPYRGAAPALTDLICGPGAGLFWACALDGRTLQDRQAARSRGDHRKSCRGVAGRADAG